MKCPFRKIIKKITDVNEMTHIIEEFADCYEENCAMWDYSIDKCMKIYDKK